MKPIKIVKLDTSINFLSKTKLFVSLSLIFIIASIFLLFSRGLNFGIDFNGGTLIEVQKISGNADVSEMRVRLGQLDLGNIQLQEFGKKTDLLIRVEQLSDEEGAQQAIIAKISEVVEVDYEIRRIEVVGPKVSAELIKKGIIAVISAVISVLIYIWFRFEWQFGIGAICALVHDIIITIGVFSLLQLEFNLSIIAALLTIVGYSLNDTVVIYDRIREELRKYKKMPIMELINQALNLTLSRTLMTSITTLLALFSLYLFGGEVIKGFTFAMIWGVLIGTYSSIFIASPILIGLNIKRDWSKKNEE
ncbi:MAG: protein translocase subunit SecF [Pseudomonadota bacterium]|nr:protein translocase subunit SecF [Pseudomonadota bacterium]MEC8496899.1 protein translocase subunit SecF [Pseudomonadota bacterium]MED5287883.1 protein translocase subunit SecF [Pseudomonadota bacterium]|tara:strand:+ start:318 stop:1235 length:918 start_codon:yes stop_codon:yes gene_type:complete